MIGGLDFLDDIFDQLREVDGLYRISQISVRDLSEQLRMSKLFLNMVIHDCRNPTSSIKLGLILIMGHMEEIISITIDQLDFCELGQKFTTSITSTIMKLNNGSRVQNIIQAIKNQIERLQGSINDSYREINSKLEEFDCHNR